jgi:2-polyprenyl-3-methyl-5-hydroxy-6-metoxy-1,4-benzoquinol methylase
MDNIETLKPKTSYLHSKLKDYTKMLSQDSRVKCECLGCYRKVLLIAGKRCLSCIDAECVDKCLVKESLLKEPPKPIMKVSSYEWKDSYYRSNPDMLQPNHQTRGKEQKGEERLPRVYDSVKRLKPRAKRLCSFGCSYGDELQALVRRFSNAKEFIGIDIDTGCIQQARKNNKAPNAFFHDDIGGLGKFDVITCLQTLFCLEKPVEKDRWGKVVKKLDEHINRNGYIFIYTSEFDPAEILTPDKYEAVNVWTREHNKKPGSCYFNGYYRRRGWFW